MKGLKGVIFDCDGVLFESRNANLAYYNAVLSRFGVEPVRAEDSGRAHLCHTAASPQVFSVLLGEERVEAALSVAATIDYRSFIPEMQPEPFLVEVLAILADQLPLAIATNRGVSMLEILQHFDLARYFCAVVTSRDVPRPKPYPDMLHLAAARLGVPAGELLFIGDSELDQAAASSAGMPFVAYRNAGIGGESVGSHRELLELISGFKRESVG